MADNHLLHLLQPPRTPRKVDPSVKEFPSSVTPTNQQTRLGSIVRDSDNKSPKKVAIRKNLKSSFRKAGNALQNTHRTANGEVNAATDAANSPAEKPLPSIPTSVPNSPSNLSVSSDSSLATFTRDFENVEVRSPALNKVQWDSSDEDDDKKMIAQSAHVGKGAKVDIQSPLPQRIRAINVLKRKKRLAINSESDSDDSNQSSLEDPSTQTEGSSSPTRLATKRMRAYSIQSERNKSSSDLLNSGPQHKKDQLQTAQSKMQQPYTMSRLVKTKRLQVEPGSQALMSQYFNAKATQTSKQPEEAVLHDRSIQSPVVKKSQRDSTIATKVQSSQPLRKKDAVTVQWPSKLPLEAIKKPKKPVIRISDDSEEEEPMSSDGDSDDDAGADFTLDEEQIKLDEQTVQFFNNATCQDIQDVTACSIQQAETIASELRPYESMDDLQEKLRNTKGLGERFITAHRDMMRGYSAVDKLIDDIEQIASDLNGIVDVWKKKELGQEIQSLPDDELEKTAMEGYLHQQPENMSSTVSLKGYQIFGVNWMLLLYRRQLSGILADEMGLGKTAQVIGFLAQLVSQGNVGPHLIIVPSSTLENWLREFQKFCPSLDVRSYYGNQRERTELQYDLRKDRSWPVLVTTYQMATGSKMDIKFLKYLKFDVTILDEGHMVKNCTSARYHSLMSIPSSFRLLLTGTPLQNNLQELVSLLTFILPSMFKENEEELQKIFKIKYTSNTVKDQGDLNSSETKAQAGSTNIAQMLSMERIKRAKRMMTPFVLRRQKSQVYNDLPKKLHVLKRCPMTERQLKVYKKVVEDSRKSLDIPETKSGDDNSGTISAEVLDLATPNRTDLKTPKSSNILMALRKAAIHPLLQRSLYTDEMLRKMAKTIMRVSTLLKYFEGLVQRSNIHHQEEEFWDSEEQYIFEDMSVMSDFELHKLCLAHRTIKEWALNADIVMDAGKVQVLRQLLIEAREKVSPTTSPFKIARAFVNRYHAPKGDRVLVFSQFTMMLDVLENVLENMGLKYSRLDGSSKVETRQGLIDEFSDDPDITVFLLSTKAGGSGINLTAAK